jgi:hypothetical protein
MSLFFGCMAVLLLAVVNMVVSKCSFLRSIVISFIVIILNTVTHEAGHIIFVLLVGGSFIGIELTNSGVASLLVLKNVTPILNCLDSLAGPFMDMVFVLIYGNLIKSSGIKKNIGLVGFLVSFISFSVNLLLDYDGPDAFRYLIAPIPLWMFYVRLLILVLIEILVAKKIVSVVNPDL